MYEKRVLKCTELVWFLCLLLGDEKFMTRVELD